MTIPEIIILIGTGLALGVLFIGIHHLIKGKQCTHENTTEIFQCTENRYTTNQCDDCGHIIYGDL